MDEYPRCVYRPGSQYRIWEFDCDMRLVADEAEHRAAKAEGWFDHPSGGHTAQAAPPPEPVTEVNERRVDEPDPEPTPEPAPEPAPPPKPAGRKRGPYRKRRKRGTLKIAKVAHGTQDSAL